MFGFRRGHNGDGPRQAVAPRSDVRAVVRPPAPAAEPIQQRKKGVIGEIAWEVVDRETLRFSGKRDVASTIAFTMQGPVTIEYKECRPYELLAACKTLGIEVDANSPKWAGELLGRISERQLAGVIGEMKRVRLEQLDGICRDGRERLAELAVSFMASGRVDEGKLDSIPVISLEIPEYVRQAWAYSAGPRESELREGPKGAGEPVMTQEEGEAITREIRVRRARGK